MNTEIEKQFEGCKLVAYPDPGTGGEPWTIGYGHTEGVKRGDVCTQSQADTWLSSDLRTALNAVHATVVVPLSDDEEGALVDLVFNIGVGNFTHSTLLKKLNARDYKGAASEFGRWNHAGGAVLAGLTRRRAAEADLFEQGIVA
ncbi:MAG: lysozyme [Massilia sp.]|nr:lysozyme [Massilia sp.]